MAEDLGRPTLTPPPAPPREAGRRQKKVAGRATPTRPADPASCAAPSKRDAAVATSSRGADTLPADARLLRGSTSRCRVRWATPSVKVFVSASEGPGAPVGATADATQYMTDDVDCLIVGANASGPKIQKADCSPTTDIILPICRRC